MKEIEGLWEKRNCADTCEKWIERMGTRKVDTVHLNGTHEYTAQQHQNTANYSQQSELHISLCQNTDISIFTCTSGLEQMHIGFRSLTLMKCERDYINYLDMLWVL